MPDLSKATPTRPDVKKELAEYLAQFVTEKRLALFDQVLAERTRHLTVVLEDIRDPLDVCAVMRSCECFGIQDLHIASQHQPFKLSSGVAVGSSKWLSIQRHLNATPSPINACITELRQRGFRIVVLSSSGEGLPIQSLPLNQKTALCLADDTCEPSLELREGADELVSIPTCGFYNHFNLSIRASLCLSTLRSRLVASSHPWKLGREEMLDLKLEWLAKMPKKIKDIFERYLQDRGLTLQDLSKHTSLSPSFLKLVSP